MIHFQLLHGSIVNLIHFLKLDGHIEILIVLVALICSYFATTTLFLLLLSFELSYNLIHVLVSSTVVIVFDCHYTSFVLLYLQFVVLLLLLLL